MLHNLTAEARDGLERTAGMVQGLTDQEKEALRKLAFTFHVLRYSPTVLTVHDEGPKPSGSF